MKKLVHNLVTVGLLGGLALFVSGCDIPGKYTGGGKMDSILEEGAKANLGFNLQAIDTDGNERIDTVKGQLQFRDHGGEGVSFHGVITDGHVVDYTPIINFIYGEFEGTYTTQPRKLGDGGDFKVSVYDAGNPGPSEMDSIRIEVTSGEYAGYVNEGLLKNGNIKLHLPPEKE